MDKGFPEQDELNLCNVYSGVLNRNIYFVTEKRFLSIIP
mgnify:CR=1 FL=1